MLYSEMVSYAERMARISPNAATLASTSDVTRKYINEGMLEFSKRAHGVATQADVVVTPRFDIGTNYAVKFAITGGDDEIASCSIYMTPTALTGASGSSVASYLQAMMNTAISAGFASSSGSVGVIWSVSTWAFRLSAAGATELYFGSPGDDTRMVDSVDLTGFQGTHATASLIGSLPEDCTLRASMPSGFLEIQYVEWNNTPLSPAPYVNFMSPESRGTPTHYAIQNKEIRLYPTPTEQGKFVIRYKGFPAAISTDGTDDSDTCALPEETHMAAVYYAAACLLEESHEPQQAIYFQQKFNSMVNDYKMRESNNNPTLFPQVSVEAAPRVVMNEP